MARYQSWFEEIPDLQPVLLQLSGRAANCLCMTNIKTLEELRQTPDAKLLGRGLGKISLREIRALAPYCGPRPGLDVEIKRIQAKVKMIEGMLRGLQADLDALAKRFEQPISETLSRASTPHPAEAEVGDVAPPTH